MSVKEAKRSLRKALKMSSPADAGALSDTLVIERIENLPSFSSARTLALYHALPGEVPTLGLLHRWSGSKRLALPVVTGDGEMVFREYTREDDLATGAFGIAEPASGREIPPEEIDLAIVPGLAFDASGHRLGHGKGFYDRFLSRPDAAHIHKVGLCPPGALVSEVPSEPHDVKMDEVIIWEFKK
jgi:5-formyltetrahydrofolate cyclo-ligase